MKKSLLPPLNWLRAFEAAARHLSFTSAAQELNLTQAGVSKQVKLLELHLGEPLFVRLPRSLALTKMGLAYLPKVRDAFDRLTSGTQEVFGRSSGDALTIRVAAAFAVNWLAPRLPAFMVRRPRVRLRLISSIWNGDAEPEGFDLDIRYGNGPWPGLRSDRLTWEDLHPLCSPALIEGENGIKEPRDLGRHTLLHVLGYEEGWADWLKAAGVPDVDSGRGHQFDTSLMAFEVAAQGGGVALGRSSLLQGAYSSGRLIRPFDLSVAVSEAFFLLSPEERSVHPDAMVFREWLLEEASGTRPS